MSAAPVLTGVATAVPARSPWLEAWLRMRRNRVAVICGILVIGVVVFSILGPILVKAIWGYTYDSRDMAHGSKGPSLRHWFGTDMLGRDLMVRVMYGGKIALGIGIVATAIATVIGVVLGGIAGYVGGAIDNAIMRVVDVLYSLPLIVIIIGIQSALSERFKDPDQRLTLMFVLIGCLSWMTIARIVRGQVLSLKNREFVEAARAVGATPRRILFKHLIPNTLGPVIVYATASIPGIMLTEAFLSFLGLGVQPPRSSWGVLISDGAKQQLSFPWMLVFPGVILAITILALNFLGDGLRDALDPQTRKVG